MSKYQPQDSIELKTLAVDIVTSKEHSFLSLEDIILNMKEDKFLVNSNQMIGYTSYLEFDKEKCQNLLSYDKNLSLKKQMEVVLLNYCVYLSSDEQQGKYYYKDIKESVKNKAKRLSRLLVDLSVEKEFSNDTNTNNEGKVR